LTNYEKNYGQKSKLNHRHFDVLKVTDDVKVANYFQEIIFNIEYDDYIKTKTICKCNKLKDIYVLKKQSQFIDEVVVCEECYHNKKYTLINEKNN